MAHDASEIRQGLAIELVSTELRAVEKSSENTLCIYVCQVSQQIPL